jgi:hypothetical protein
VVAPSETLPAQGFFRKPKDLRQQLLLLLLLLLHDLRSPSACNLPLCQ